ncbi:hypothetical protein [Flaviaesturariibacter aridisoli]|uniref:Uncharacterized protein n=1 Tax=Flaviaesturariibacter aridisoli TaxID=2545761 RepID=A0A4R4E753_9BACT|nr:hypothetical protein [Flaviaesturariibacter aridisoli]TCZ73861.1 hypothetical protein E0486_04045 [Flaviaesturariibacter aridisoli]
MRRLLAFCCVLLLLLTLGGRSLFFELRLAELRTEMRTAIAEGTRPASVAVFSFSATDSARVHWLENGQEFEWKGKRYDVLSRRRSGEKTLIQAIPDDRETVLVAGFRQQQGKSGGLPASVLLLKLSGMSYLAPSTLETIPAETTILSVHNRRCRQLLPQTYRSRPGRPPRTQPAFS